MDKEKNGQKIKHTFKNQNCGINFYIQKLKTSYQNNEYIYVNHSCFTLVFLLEQQFDDAHNNNPPIKATFFKKSI